MTNNNLSKWKRIRQCLNKRPPNNKEQQGKNKTNPTQLGLWPPYSTHPHRRWLHILALLLCFGSGVKSGTLNYVVLKGDIFKTYEGKLIMEGIESRTQGQLQSNSFLFSIEDEELAKNSCV